MRRFLASLALAVTSSLVWVGIVIIFTELGVGSSVHLDDLIFGGIIITAALSFGVPLIIRLFKVKPEES